MTIQIKRNNAGNCITFIGSSKPVYFNSCLSGRVNPDDSNRIDIINDINTTDINNPSFEFFAVDYNLFRNENNESFLSAQEAADYITSQGNTIGNTGTFELQSHNSLAFTKTTDGLTILVDNGDAHALETLSAKIDTNDNTKLEITNHTGSRVLYSNIYPDNILYNNNLLLTGSLNDMVNQLNAYFSGVPLQSDVSEGVVTLLSGGEYVTIWYIENEENIFSYPLFKNADDANLVAEDLGNSGHTSILFPNDPTNTTWYLPNGGNTSVSTDPTGLTYQIDGVSAIWNEQTASYPAPGAFVDTTIIIDELTNANIPVTPAGVPYTTTIANINGSNFVYNNGNLVGTAPEVLQDNVVNPSDDYQVTITRTNSYGSSTGTLTVRVNNLTAPIVLPISGFTWENTSTILVDSDTLADGSVVSLDDTVASGRRLIIPQTWVETNILPNLTEANDFIVMGIKDGTPTWGSLDIGDFDVHIKWQWASSTSHISTLGQGGVNQSNATIASLTDAYYDYAFEVDGNDVHLIACNNSNDINTQHSINDGGSFSRFITKSGITGPHTIYVGAKNTTADISVIGLNEINIPATPVNSLTNFNKAIDFSGGNEYIKLATTSVAVSPMRMGGAYNVVLPNPSDPSKTSSEYYSRPWATAIIFKYDGNSSSQHIWNSGEGNGTGNDNIYLRLDSSGYLYFGWGRSGSLNECKFLYLGTTQNTNHWHGIYIASNGTRLSASNATAANLAAAFDIRCFTSNYTGGVFGSQMDNKSTASNWTNGSTGGRMDRDVLGNLTIGGRSSNKNFHGKVASFVTTSLLRNVDMPTNAEITMMIEDPMSWLNDYKVGNPFRYSYSSTVGNSFTIGDAQTGYATQVWLMGDGTYDSFSAGIRNQVNPSDQTYSKLTFNSMLSNDIENITINGL